MRDLGLTLLDVHVHFKFAPLSSRRDMALLGLIHHSVLGKAPQHFHAYVRPPWRWRMAQRVRQRHRSRLGGPIDGMHLVMFCN